MADPAHMEIIVQQKPQEEFHEISKIEIAVPDLGRVFALDLDFSAILQRSWQPHIQALDFLMICAVTYAIDKIAKRSDTPDLWKRTLDVTMPLWEPGRWSPAAEALSKSVSFLTGDSWSFQFTQASSQFQKKRKNRRKYPKPFPKAPLVSLLSGG